MLTNTDMNTAMSALVEAMDDAALDLEAEDIAGEEDFTGQLIGRWKQKIKDIKTHSSTWRVKAELTEEDDGPARPSVRFSSRQTTSKGPGSEESWSGADLLVVLEIKSQDYEVRKGLLVQAKRLEKEQHLEKRDADKLRNQCRDMLDLSPSSYVFVYSTSGVTVLSATLVEASQRRDLHALEQWPNSANIFFLDFMKCWTGDPRLKATDRESLAILRALSDARNAVLIQASDGVSDG